MPDFGYQKLEVYKLAHELAVRIHKMTLALPAFEKFEEGSQVRRSSKRVSASIVEGFALRKYKALFCSYLYRALASSDETQEHLRYLLETNAVMNPEEGRVLLKSSETLSKKLARFIQGVERKHGAPQHVTADSSIDEGHFILDPEADLIASVSDIRDPKSAIRGSSHGREFR